MSKEKKKTKLRFWADWEPNPNVPRIHAGEVVAFPATAVRNKGGKKK